MASIFPIKMKSIVFLLLVLLIAFMIIKFNSRVVAFLNGGTASSLCTNIVSSVGAVVISPHGDKIIAMDIAGEIVIFSTSSNSVIASIPVSVGENAVAFSPDNSSAFVVSLADRSQIIVVDLNTNKITRSLSIAGELSDLKNILISKDGLKLYLAVSVKGKQQVLVVSSSTGLTITSTVIEGGISSPITMSPDGSKIYVVGRFFSVVNTSTNIIESATPLEQNLIDSAAGVAINSDGSLLAVGVTGSPGMVKIINLSDYASSYSISLGTDESTVKNENGVVFPNSISFAPNGQQLFVSHHYKKPGKISIINIEKRSVVSSINLSGSFPVGVAITPDGEKAYVGISDDKGAYVAVIDAHNGNTLTKIPTPLSPKEKSGCLKSQ